MGNFLADSTRARRTGNQRNIPVTRILVALPRSWKNMETHGRLTKTHGKT